MTSRVPKIFGILNITEDSFSDGGLYLDRDSALKRGNELIQDGVDVIDIGPASSNPDARTVAPDEEIRRIEPVFDAYSGKVPLSVDTFRPETQRWAMSMHVDFLNDIHGFPHQEMYEELSKSDCRLVVMHSVQQIWKAEKVETDPATMLERIESFFARRIEELTGAGIDRSRIIIDPGMGYFLGSNPSSSIAVLASISRLRDDIGLPVMISVSRKSFLRALTGRGTGDIGAATLSAELFAAIHGVDYIRTHDVRSLKDALVVLEALIA